MSDYAAGSGRLAKDGRGAVEIAVADIGGTHARFAIARLHDENDIGLDQLVTLATADYAGLDEAWRAFGKRLGRDLPGDASLAVAAPIAAETISLTNSRW